MMNRNTLLPAARGDIVESELLDILQTVIEARCGLSAIHHLLDSARTMSDIHARFTQWETSQHAVNLQSTQRQKMSPRVRPVPHRFDR